MTLQRLRLNEPYLKERSLGKLMLRLIDRPDEPAEAEQHGPTPQREEALEEIRDAKPKSAAEQYDEIYPAMSAVYTRCGDVELKIGLGTASPKQIRDAQKPSGDPFLDMYTQKYRDEVTTACINHGIEADTGKPDGRAAELLLAAIEAGLSDRQALQHAYLGGHGKIPDQMMSDKRFRERLEEARQAAQAWN